jgi:Uma2 family endonuclease
MTTDEYLYETAESNRKRELAGGVLREPPAPYFSHQQLVLKVARMLCDHVEPRELGKVAVAPVDVVLDHDRNLVVQPDVLFISTARLSIIRNQVWGAPDLVVEVLSLGTAGYDRVEKLEWYRQYGVRECWLVDLPGYGIVINDFTGAFPVERVSKSEQSVQSSVFPDLLITAHRIFL